MSFLNVVNVKYGHFEYCCCNALSFLVWGYMVTFEYEVNDKYDVISGNIIAF